MGHLVADVFEETLLLVKLVIQLLFVRVNILLDLLEMLSDDFSVEIFLLLHLSFMSLQGLLPSDILSRVRVLDHPRVLLGAHVATVV